MQEVFRNLGPLLVTFGLGIGLLGGLVYVLSLQDAAPKILARILWLSGALLIILGIYRWVSR